MLAIHAIVATLLSSSHRCAVAIICCAAACRLHCRWCVVCVIRVTGIGGLCATPRPLGLLVGVGAIDGVPCAQHSSLSSLQCTTVAVVGWQHARHLHLAAQWTVVVEGSVDPIAVSWPLMGRGTAVFGDRHHALVRSARAFGPGQWWTGGGVRGVL